jgi:TRAP-type C4-dicarboxylate transport system permease small subunit
MLPDLPKPPLRPCPAESRAGALCFWTVLLLFFAGIGYLGMLAFSRNAGQSQPSSSINGHVVSGSLLVGCAIAAVIGVIATRYKRFH